MTPVSKSAPLFAKPNPSPKNANSQNRFATIPQNLSYWTKQDKPLFADLLWNIPEQKQNRVAVIGGNTQNFSAVVKISERLANDFPLKTVETILPDALRSQLPNLPNFTFLPSTTTGSFAKSPLVKTAVEASDFTLVAGDLSKNSATTVALADALTKTANTPAKTAPAEATEAAAKDAEAANPQKTLLARDSLDTLLPEMHRLVESPDLFLVASLAQLQKLLRALYYPKVLLLSSPLLPVIDTLHKFTLSYPLTLLTFHDGQIIIANSGKIITTPIEKTAYTPLSLWSGPLATKVLALNLWNPNKPLEATAAALFA